MCTNNGCAKRFYAKDLCKTCYNLSLRANGKSPPKPCQAKDCDRTAWSGRFCSTHYARRRDGRMDVPIRRHNYQGCDTEGCENPHYAMGMCRSHYKKPRSEDGYAENNLKAKYGIDADERDALVAAQDCLCAICEDPPAEGKILEVDHDHSHCGGPRKGCRHCVRGVLCRKCNRRLERIEDALWLQKADPEWVRKAQAYLVNPPAHLVIERPKPARKRGRPFADAEELLRELGLRP